MQDLHHRFPLNSIEIHFPFTAHSKSSSQILTEDPKNPNKDCTEPEIIEDETHIGEFGSCLEVHGFIHKLHEVQNCGEIILGGRRKT